MYVVEIKMGVFYQVRTYLNAKGVMNRRPIIFTVEATDFAEAKEIAREIILRDRPGAQFKKIVATTVT